MSEQPDRRRSPPGSGSAAGWWLPVLLTLQPAWHSMVGLSLQPTSTPRVYEVRFQNLTAEDVEMPVDLTLSLHPVGDDPARPLQRSRLYSSVDPATGAFGGVYAGRESRLKLARGQVRAIRIDLNDLRWSLGPSWTWTPRELWRMVEPGAYELSVSLECDRAPIWGYGRLPAALVEQ